MDLALLFCDCLCNNYSTAFFFVCFLIWYIFWQEEILNELICAFYLFDLFLFAVWANAWPSTEVAGWAVPHRPVQLADPGWPHWQTPGGRTCITMLHSPWELFALPFFFLNIHLFIYFCISTWSKIRCRHFVYMVATAGHFITRPVKCITWNVPMKRAMARA